MLDINTLRFEVQLNKMDNSQLVLSPLVAEDLIDRLEAAEEERDALRAALRHEADCAEAAKAEIEALRAKIAKMEQQELARLVTPTAYRWRYRGAIKWQYGELTEEAARLAKEHNREVQPLYALPGAQPAPSVPEGWLRAIDEALIVAHIGVANESDTYEQAKVKLNNLICFHADIATDPAVNGGWKLVPIEPTESFYKCFSAYDGTSYSNPFDYDDFVKDWSEALAAAPEAKP